MKKIIALALALVMILSMSVTALAKRLPVDEMEWGEGIILPFPIEVTADRGMYVAPTGEAGLGRIMLAPGATITFDLMRVRAYGLEEDEEAYCRELMRNLEFEFSASKGGALIASTETVKDKAQFKIHLKENYTLDEVKDLFFKLTVKAKRDFSTGGDCSPDFKRGDLLLELDFTADGVAVDSIYGDSIIVDRVEIAEVLTEDGLEAASEEALYAPLPGPGGFRIPFVLGVANAVRTVYGEEEKDDAPVFDITGEENNDFIYKVEEDEAGYAKFGGTDSLFQITADMADKEKLFMHLIEDDEDLLKDLQEKNPDADLSAYTLEGRVAFRNPAEFTLQADYADQYRIYALNGNKLDPVKTEWDSIEGLYRWNAKEMGTYIISDTELVAAAEETKNPDTGANDVVGVAAALAVSALIAGAAVTLKK